MIDDCLKRLDHYEQNPNKPNARIFVHALSARLDAMLKLQFTEQQNDFYNE